MSLDDATAHLVNDVDTAMEFKRWMSNKDLVGLDTEGTGLDPTIDRVRLTQYGDRFTSWVIPFERWGGVVDEMTNRYTGRYTMHNAQYDQAMLAHEGCVIPTHKIDDTRLMLHVLTSTESLALKNAAVKHVDPRTSAGQSTLSDAMASSGWTWETIPITFGPYWQYAGLDTILTYQLHEKLWPQVKAEAREAYDLELAVSWVCSAMRNETGRGVLVDRAYTMQFADELNTFIEQATKWCNDVYNINPGSDLKLIEILERDGVELIKRTASGRFSVDKEVLESIDHPLAQLVLNRRRSVKTVSTYLNNYLKFSERDGLIRPSINTVGGTARNQYEPGGSGRGVRTGQIGRAHV